MRPTLPATTLKTRVIWAMHWYQCLWRRNALGQSLATPFAVTTRSSSSSQSRRRPWRRVFQTEVALSKDQLAELQGRLQRIIYARIRHRRHRDEQYQLWTDAGNRDWVHSNDNIPLGRTIRMCPTGNTSAHDMRKCAARLGEICTGLRTQRRHKESHAKITKNAEKKLLRTY